MGNNRTVTVRVPHKPVDIKTVQLTIANIFKELGHPGCYSGFDFRFEQEVEFTAGLNGEVRQIGAVGE
jgi:hypothetical protein